jgi:hypothetical protein
VRIVDALDALAAIGAFIVLLVLVATGRVPKDFELWGYGLSGGLLIAGVVIAVRKRQVWKRKK